MADAAANWYEHFFEHDYLDEIAPAIDEEVTSRDVDFVVEKLALEPAARVLDVGCGHGRHSLELARRGFRVVGVDLSPRSIERAAQTAEREGLDVEFLRADARVLAFDAEFDAAISIFTSVVGFFEDQADDRRVVGRVARALRPGGSFLIDTINLLAIPRAFQEIDWLELESGTIVLERRGYDFGRGRSETTWTFLHRDGGRREFHTSLHVYAPHELIAMLEDAGLDVVDSWGDFEGAALSFDRWRLILRGDKP